MKYKKKDFQKRQLPKASFFGIYDGQNGSRIADLLRDHLHEFIAQSKSFPTNPVQAIFDGFAKAGKLVAMLTEESLKRTGRPFGRDSASALVLLIIERTCYMGSLGKG